MNDSTQGGVRSTTVKYTGSGKAFGLDSFLSIETTHEWNQLVDDETVVRRQDELVEQLSMQVTDLLKTAAEKAKAQRPAVSVHPVQAPPVAGVAYGQPAPAGTGAPAVVAVANGATQQEGDWRSVPSRFGDGQVRFVSSLAYPSAQLKEDVYRWIGNQGIDPNYFDVWDERTGPRGAESGNPIGSVFNIKVNKDSQHLVPAEFARNAAGRGKFNNDGSIYPYWSKDFEAFLKYGGVEKLAL